MPPALSPIPSAAKPRGTAAWLLATSLLLSLLCFAHAARPLAAHPQATYRPAPLDSALILPASWHR